MKTRKSLTKRFKITKIGKIFRRRIGQNHFRAKKTGKQIRESRKLISVSKQETKKIRKLIK